MKSVEKSRKFVYRVSFPHLSYCGKAVYNISSYNFTVEKVDNLKCKKTIHAKRK